MVTKRFIKYENHLKYVSMHLNQSSQLLILVSSVYYCAWIYKAGGVVFCADILSFRILSTVHLDTLVVSTTLSITTGLLHFLLDCLKSNPKYNSENNSLIKMIMK